MGTGTGTSWAPYWISRSTRLSGQQPSGNVWEKRGVTAAASQCNGIQCGRWTCRPAAVTGGWPITAAIIRGTQVGPALQHFSGNPIPGWRDHSCSLLCPHAGCRECSRLSAARRDGLGNTSPWSIPRRCRSCRRVRNHSVETHPPERFVRSRRFKVLLWKVALPGIGHMPAP